LVLSELAQLEVASKNVAVFISELVAKSLHGVCVDKRTSCFTFSMNCVGDFASVFATFVANRVNIAVGFAAALLSSEAIFCDAFTSHVEAVFHAIVNSIETITETIGDATELSVYILVVETFEKVRASNCALYCGIVSTISEDTAIAENGKPYKIDKGVVPKFAIHKAICVITSNSGDIGGCEFMRHIYVLLLKYNIF
jgi:hypothetical protein